MEHFRKFTLPRGRLLAQVMVALLVFVLSLHVHTPSRQIVCKRSVSYLYISLKLVLLTRLSPRVPFSLWCQQHGNKKLIARATGLIMPVSTTSFSGTSTSVVWVTPTSQVLAGH